MPVISMFYGIIVMMYYFDNRRHHEPHIRVQFSGKEACGFYSWRRDYRRHNSRKQIEISAGVD